MFVNQYLGKRINGWKVVSYVNAPSRHKIYTITKGILWWKQTKTIRDNVLTQFARGEVKF